MSNYQFYPEQNVVCVDDSGSSMVKKGQTYTVRSVGRPCGHGSPCLDVGIRGQEWACSTCDADQGGVFYPRASRFRPLDSLTEQVERIEKEGAPVELQPLAA